MKPHLIKGIRVGVLNPYSDTFLFFYKSAINTALLHNEDKPIKDD